MDLTQAILHKAASFLWSHFTYRMHKNKLDVLQIDFGSINKLENTRYNR